MERMKILHSEASTGWGGQEIRIFEEMRWFRSQGHDLMLVAPPHGVLAKRAAEEGFQTAHCLFTKNRIGREVFRFSSIIRKFKPDVVATHSSVDSWVGLVASTIHRIKRRVRYRHVSTPVKGHLINRWQYKKLCNLVLTTGECIRKPLIEMFVLPPGKVVSAPTAIRPPAEMPEREDAKSKLQSELGLASSSRFIGQVSVLRSWKGHKFLIEAFDSIADSFPNLHLVLVGTGPIEEDIKKIASIGTHGERIHLVGHKNNPWPYFRAFDIATLASVSNEGIPQSLLQAMHAETPVIGTSVGGIPEIVRNESTGLLVKPSETPSLANAMTRLLGDYALQSKMSRNAHELTSENFRWDSLGQKIEDLFKV
jgi:glycosyltransferase involved in cell wall biosynthesis